MDSACHTHMVTCYTYLKFVELVVHSIGEGMGRCPHSLLTHLALVHVPGALVEVRVRSELSYGTQHGLLIQLHVSCSLHRV
jgi:hypothetical protein